VLAEEYLYRAFQECQCIQSVAVLSRATLLADEYTGCFRSASVYRVLHYCLLSYRILQRVMVVP
jgi:hypothetical protein